MESTITKKNRFQLSEKSREYVVLIICLICISLFGFAAHGKLADHETFAKGLAKVPGIGSYSSFIAWMVPASEIFIASLIIFPRTHIWGLYGFTGLMTVFTLYILAILAVDKKLPCHCNLFVEELSWLEHIWFNLTFISLSVTAILLSKKLKQQKPLLK